MIPAHPGSRHMPIERLTLTAQVLEFGRARVRGAAHDEDFLVLVRQEGSDRVIAKVGMDGDRIRSPGFEYGVRIGLRGAAHVATLGIENHWTVLRQCGERLVEQPARLPSP